jgi:hypothetical protein
VKKSTTDLAIPEPVAHAWSVANALPAIRPDSSFAEQLWAALSAADWLTQTPVRGLPLARLVSPVQDGSAYFTVTTIDSRGRLADGSPLRILRWAPRLPLTFLVVPGAVVVAAQHGGREAVTRQGHLRLPAALRHTLRLKAGDRMLVAAFPDRGLLVAYRISVLDEMVSAYNASLAAGRST